MKSVLIDIEDKDQETALFIFLNRHKHEYYITETDNISASQKEELLQRECDFKSGKIKTTLWEDVRKQFLHNK